VNTLLSNGINLIVFVVIFAVLVFVHELGHFVVAKRLRIPVPEFGFGFPPRLWRFWKGNGWIEIQGRHMIIPRDFELPQNLAVGTKVRYKTRTENEREILDGLEIVDEENQGTVLASPVQNLDRGTEYTLNWIPLGGFVRLMGEDDANVPGGFATAKPSVRAPILLAGVTMNFVLAFVAFLATALLAPPYAQVQTTRVSGIVQDSPAAVVGLRAGDIIAAVNGQKLQDDYPTLRQLLRQNAGREVTLTVIRNDREIDPVVVTPRVNPPAGEGPLGIALIGWVGLTASDVAPGSVAAQVGVRPGDVVIFIVDPKANRPLRDQNELSQFVQTHPGWKVDWQIKRANEPIRTVTAQIPDSVTPQDATLGLNLQTALLDAPGKAISEMGLVLGSIPTLISQLIGGTVPPNSLVGPLGIYQATGEIAQRGGALALLDLLGLLSLNLAIVNLLPIPALDGGRLIFVLIEWLRGGKRLAPEKEGVVHLIGLAVLLGLMIIISFFDVQRMIAGQPILPP
jgi:regulator of sigma E protease